MRAVILKVLMLVIFLTSAVSAGETATNGTSEPLLPPRERHESIPREVWLEAMLETHPYIYFEALMFNEEHMKKADLIAQLICLKQDDRYFTGNFVPHLRNVLKLAEYPSPSFGFIGALIRSGSCMKKEVELGDHLLKMGWIAAAPFALNHKRTWHPPFSRGAEFPARSRPMFANEQRGGPVSFNEYITGYETPVGIMKPLIKQLGKLHQGDPQEIANIGYALLHGNLSVSENGTIGFDGNIGPYPRVAYWWLYEAGLRAQTPSLVKDTVRWFINPEIKTTLQNDHQFPNFLWDNYKITPTNAISYLQKLEAHGQRYAGDLLLCLFESADLPQKRGLSDWQNLHRVRKLTQVYFAVSDKQFSDALLDLSLCEAINDQATGTKAARGAQAF